MKRYIDFQRGQWLCEDLVDTLIRFRRDVFRNIPTIAISEELLDDLSDDPKDRAVGEALVNGLERAPDYESAIITRPFRYGTTFSGAPYARLSTRFSDGSRFGVWYGSLDLITTVYETVYHWPKFLGDLLTETGEEVIAERRVFKVHAGGLFVDLRAKHERFPGLIDPESYAFTHPLGSYLYDNHQSALLVASARHNKGVNLAASRPDVLSNVRHHSCLTYRRVPGDDRVSIEKTAGKPWKKLQI